MVLREMQKYKVAYFAVLPWWTCDIVCHDCLFSSGPNTSGKLEFATLAAAISEAVACCDLRTVSMSGGEPFLYPEYVYRLAAHVISLGCTFRVVTNANFATSLDVAIGVLAPLKKLGAESIYVSWDRFHSQFVPAERIRHAIQACRTLGLNLRLTVVTTRSNTIDTSLCELGDDAFDVPISQSKCLPIGRAVKKIEASEFLAPSKLDKGRACAHDFDTIAMTYDGSLYPCCAVGGFTDALKLGRYPELSLGDLLKRRSGETKWQILQYQGPTYLRRHASRTEATLLGLSDQDHDCVTCNKIFSSPIGETLVGRANAFIKTSVQAILRNADVER